MTLLLRRETLTALDDAELAEVRGGITFTCVTMPPSAVVCVSVSGCLTFTDDIGTVVCVP